MPRHVALIMDGNGRWAARRGLPRIEGHRRGVENVRSLLATAHELGIPYLTLYAFSAENWNRPPAEVGALMGLLETFLGRHRAELIQNDTRLHLLGDPERLPPSVRQALDTTLRDTAHCQAHHLLVALNYGARQETLQAVRACLRQARDGQLDPETLDWPQFAAHLDTAGHPDPDLLIRTSGEMRLSNFLLLQSAYSELYFTPTPWPDFGKAEFLQAIADYRTRERRFGLTTAPPTPGLHPSP